MYAYAAWSAKVLQDVNKRLGDLRSVGGKGALGISGYVQVRHICGVSAEVAYTGAVKRLKRFSTFAFCNVHFAKIYQSQWYGANPNASIWLACSIPFTTFALCAAFA